MAQYISNFIKFPPRIVLTLAVACIAAGQAQAQQAALVEEGRRLFEEETFNGNGRTCATCHPRTNNFTIDPAFIATLPPTDPLFVNEQVPELAALEDSSLLRNFGLICENLDTFEQSCVFRGVPHTLGLSTSLTPDDVVGAVVTHATGWGGDGSPGDGSLRSFATGAVIQHFPRTLNRIEGVDFRLPTEAELDAMEAFQRSLGRRAEVIDMANAQFRQPVAERGRLLFENLDEIDDRGCNACHFNGGATTDGITNANFDTGTRSNFPGLQFDDGFGNGFSFPGEGGDGTFNTPPLVEAAGTGPFFHNNSATTIEGAILFYVGDLFARSPSGQFGGAFQFTPDDITAVGAMLRTLFAVNVAQNTVARLRSVPARRPATRGPVLEVIAAELGSGIQVLTGGPIPGLAPTAVERFQAALGILAQPVDNEALVQVDRLLSGRAPGQPESIRQLLIIDPPAQVATVP